MSEIEKTASGADAAGRLDGLVGQHDTDWTEFPVCPHCGTQDQDWWDGLPPKMTATTGTPPA